MPTIQWLEICGFRAFTKAQKLEFTGPLALISGPNSQGKTSIAEAIEFLLCGETLRRALLGGAKAEFEGTLRNAHLPDDDPVWIKAGIVGPDGVAHVVKRSLTKDYPADSVCESELTIDDQPAVDLSELGIVLSDPPLRTPILFQHTVRFALSAAPKERAEYFRAIIEVADLELVREEVIALREQLTPPTDVALQHFTRAASPAVLEPVISAIRDAADEDALHGPLAEGIAIAATELGISGGHPEASLAEQATWLRDAVRSYAEQAFQAAQFEASAPPDLESPQLRECSGYATTAADADHEVERLGRLFEAILDLPHLIDTDHPVDCPVCETPSALTPARLEAMRQELSEASHFRTAQAAALGEVDTISADLSRIETALTRARPAALGLNADQLQERCEQAEGLLEGAGDRLAALLEPLRTLGATNESASQELVAARERLTTLRADIAAGRSADLGPSAQALEALGNTLAQAALAHTAYAEAARPLLTEIRAAAAERQKVGAFSSLAELAPDPAALWKGLERQRAHQRRSEQLEAAIADIERGIGKVVDAKFKAMSAEIATWWELLRPQEPVEFSRVGRRGAGRRYVLFKALLRPSIGAEGVERDALGVFSDSQLNALGLAAFLARCSKQGTPFIVLDDPVQAGDEDHRATFTAEVVQALIDRGIQAIVVSHDEMLSKLMHSRYEHLPINGFAITMETPGDGARVIPTSDTAKALLQRAAATLRNENPEIRKQNAAKVREAGERLAKEILVKKRTEAGGTVTLADYDGTTLGPLIADLEPHFNDASHKGKWRNVNELTSRGGPHDTEVPTVNDLVVAHGDLKRFRKDYLSSDDGS